MAEKRPKLGVQYVSTGLSDYPVVVRDFVRSQRTEELWVVFEDLYDGSLDICTVEYFLEELREVKE